MNGKSALSFLAILAVFIVLIGWIRERALVLDTATSALQMKVADLEQQLAQKAPPPVESQAQARAETLELMRLRNEVTQLRAASQTVARLEAENARLAAEMQKLRAAPSIPADPSSSSQRFSRDQWSFQGYSTPESAYISGMWAMKEGQIQSVLDSFTPEERQRFEAKNQGKTEEEIAARFQKEFGELNALQILGKRQISPNEVVLDVYLDGARSSLKRVRMNQVGHEWKAGGPINQNAVTLNARMNPSDPNADYDPLAFYRKNPELMKRYFPHLFKEQQAEQPNPAQ
jgi:hypothetical protein